MHRYAPTGILPGGDPEKFYFPESVVDAFAAQAATAAPGLNRSTRMMTEPPHLTLQQAREIVTAAMRDFDPALGRSAEKVFAEGFDAAADDARRARFDWKENLAAVDPPQRWRIQQVDPGNAGVQRSIPANSPATELNPKNPNRYSVIDYQFDGTIGSLVYLAHELGHTIADDNLQKGGKYKAADNPAHMAETQAYFTQNVLYDYIRNHPELDQKYPGITKLSQEHFNATMAENIAYFDTARDATAQRRDGSVRDAKATEALDYSVNRLQIRPMGILGGLGLFNAAKADPAHRAEITSATLSGQGPKTFAEVAAVAGVTNAQDMDRFARQTVASAARPKTPVVNIVIDVGDWDPQHSKGSKADHDAYIKKVNDSVATLRKQGIPTIFVAITDDTVAHPASGPRDPKLLQRLHMTELNVGPGDDVFEKRFMSGFTTIDDVLKSATLEKYVMGQRKDGAGYINAKFGDTTLHDLLKAKGAEHVTLMGTVAQYCITDNSIDAARRGLGVTVLTDTVQAWNDKSVHDKVVWPKDPKTVAKEVAATLQEVRDNPAGRGIDPTDTAAIASLKNIKLLTVDRFLQSAPALTATPPVTPPAPSKFMTPKAAGAVQEHGGTTVGVAAVGLDIAEGHYGRALTDTAMQVSLTPATYEAAAHLAEEAGSVAKLLGEVGKKIPVAGAVITGGFVLYEVGSNLYQGKFGRAGAALAAGTAEAAGNFLGFGVGDVARETVREGVVLTAGEDYAPDKSGLRQLGERAYDLGAKAVGSEESGQGAAKRTSGVPKATI